MSTAAAGSDVSARSSCRWRRRRSSPTALYVFMIAWNEFLFALLFLSTDRTEWTVSLGLSQLSGGIEVPTTVLMAGSVVLTLPIVVLFFAAERLLTEGLTAGADKG